VTFSQQPGSGELPRCANGHSMATADNFCPLCGARRQADPAATSQSTETFAAFPGDGTPAGHTGRYPDQSGFQQPGSYQQAGGYQPGSYQQPGGYQDPAGYQPPGAYQSPSGGYQQPGTYPPGTYPPGTYPQQPGYWPQGGYPASQSTNGLAIASLVLGLFWVFWIGSVLGLVFGLIALGQIKRNNQKGRPLAITGIVLGGIGVVILLLAILAAAVGGGSPATVSPG